MITLASGLRVYLACGVTDMRKGMVGLAMLVQQSLGADPFDGAVFAFRGRRAQCVSFYRLLVIARAAGQLYRIDSCRILPAAGRLRAARLSGLPPSRARRKERARASRA